MLTAHADTPNYHGAMPADVADAAVDRGPQREPLLVFVHIPKTAGTTLRTILSMNEPGARSRALANVFKGGGGISKTMIERLRKGEAARAEAGATQGCPLEDQGAGARPGRRVWRRPRPAQDVKGDTPGEVERRRRS
jgi:hypothetical protein